jgi:hypothetical protein
VVLVQERERRRAAKKEQIRQVHLFNRQRRYGTISFNEQDCSMNKYWKFRLKNTGIIRLITTEIVRKRNFGQPYYRTQE